MNGRDRSTCQVDPKFEEGLFMCNEKSYLKVVEQLLGNTVYTSRSLTHLLKLHYFFSSIHKGDLLC